MLKRALISELDFLIKITRNAFCIEFVGKNFFFKFISAQLISLQHRHLYHKNIAPPFLYMTYIERVGVYFYATSACGLQCVIHLSRGEGGVQGELDNK